MRGRDLALLRSPPPFQGLCPPGPTLILDSAHGVLIGPAPGALYRDAPKVQLILPNQKQGPGNLVAHELKVRLNWAAFQIFNIRGSLM